MDLTASGASMAGYQMLVRGDIMRAKFRNSFEKPEPLIPGTPTHLKFTMNDVLHTFRKGHRIMVQVQSYWFPVADRNPNVFCDLSKCRDSDFVPARITLLSGGSQASKLVISKL